MIAFVKGKLEEIESDYVVIDRNGIGFKISVPGTVIPKLPNKGEEIKLHTYFHVKEDVMQLFGFLIKEDLNLFKLLITVNGVGPKVALAILSSFSADVLIFAILSEDYKTISKAPGVGKKIAQKIVLEIKDKVTKIFDEKILSLPDEESDASAQMNQNDAIEVLKALGYSAAEALKAVQSVENASELTSDEIVKFALKKMS